MNARVESRGLELDRRWMLVDEQGIFLTQRTHPELALFELKIDSAKLLVTNQENGKHTSVPFEPKGEWCSALVWDDKVDVKEVSAGISKWFSEQLQQNIRLVYMPNESRRKVDERYVVNINDIVSFADGYPILITNDASLVDLNSRLEEKVEMERFRPNIVVDSLTPFEEDTWSRLQTDTIELSLVKKCARCVMVNINPATGKKGTEVLAKLSEYRREGNKVYFGTNAIPVKTGIIQVGDILEAS